MTDDRMIAALLRERDGYALYGNEGGVAAVDEQLALHGYQAPAAEPKQTETAPPAPAAKAPAKAPAKTQPRARRAPRKATA
jgi:hypothetical protein